jgi:hypothetical protein
VSAVNNRVRRVVRIDFRNIFDLLLGSSACLRVAQLSVAPFVPRLLHQMFCVQMVVTTPGEVLGIAPGDEQVRRLATGEPRQLLLGVVAEKETCQAADAYRRGLRDRYEKEAQTLASLTGWEIDEIRRTMGSPPDPTTTPAPGKPWWERIWGD